MATESTMQTMTLFTPAERRALRVLRTRYRREPDLFDSREMARLRFMRWLANSGQIPS